ncbi:Zinc finger protein CONSTANS-LIKE 5 [Striga hermonthica]|uniref:Zinc finger protein CONSTANS-LIKE 5 n=1 Tax=Striga hermonthica TaxID=68872 RepID=A0A9N7MPU5_STRHE|nr:Zinc finger protein CONSTANS-LIKE 5 [Striga hermonthica]
MVQEDSVVARAKLFPAGLPVAARPCDCCRSAAALLFCAADSAFMCIACDAVAHRRGASHGRVWLCEVCEQAPAAVTCRADAAALCTACDRDIHSANPLAGRHDRVPVVPFHDAAESALARSAASFLPPAADDSHIPDSWIDKLQAAGDGDLKSMELLFQDSDQFLDFDNFQIPSQPYGDSVVPVQAIVKPVDLPVHDSSPENRFMIDFSGSNINNCSYTAPTLSQSVSSSSMEVGIVPDGGSFSETSFPFGRSIGSTGSQVVGMDREARVLRYREKRKNRKFEKTIRYASRKAYAETRPRIKGRFAKRTESESESDIDQIFVAGAASFIADARYGVVPSF